MAPDAVTQDRVYRGLRETLLAGGFKPRARIDLQRMAERFGASTTPVREALHRLIGERLVEPHGEGGFQPLLPDAEQLIHAYGWNAQHLLAAVHSTREPVLQLALQACVTPRSDAAPTDQALAISGLFAAIGRATGNGEFLCQIEAANARLHLIRIAEARLFGDLSREHALFVRRNSLSVHPRVRRRIIAYHRRRIEHVPQILEALYYPGPDL